MKTITAFAAAVLLAAGTDIALAQVDITSGVFTADQAARGSELYAMNCGGCHGAELVSSDAEAPSFTGFTFTLNWTNKTVAERFERIKTTMPLGNPGSLSDQEYLDVISYILSFNKYPDGSAELSPDSDLEAITISRLSN
jgi:mono/diheme cytochrome c family protein